MGTNPRFSIKRKVAFLILIASLVVGAVGLSVGYTAGMMLVSRIIGKYHAMMADLLATSLRQMINVQVNTIEAYLSSQTWMDAVSLGNARYEGMTDEQVRAKLTEIDTQWIAASKDAPQVKELLSTSMSDRLMRLVAVDRTIAKIFLTDRYGGVVASSRKTNNYDQSAETWWIEAFSAGKGKVYISTVEFDNGLKKWIMVIALPVKNTEGQVIGVCKTALDAGAFFAPLQDFKLGKSGHAMLLNEDGLIVSYKTITPMSTAFYPGMKLFEFLYDKARYRVLNSTNISSEELLVGIAPVASAYMAEKRISWYVLTIQPLSEIYFPLKRIMYETIGIMFVLLLAIMVPLGLFLGGIFVKPILRLRKVMESVRAGKWDTEWQIKTGDEIEEFAGVFKSMMATIQKRQQELEHAKQELGDLAKGLEERIAERTRTLTDTQDATLNILEDLTDAKENLEKYSQQLEDAVKIKSDFTSMVSHELRTPLTAIKESISIVYDGVAGEITAEQKEFLELAKRNVDRLARLINDILDFQKLESGKMTFTMKDQSVNEFIWEVYRMMLPLAKSKGLSLELALGDALPMVKLDRDKMIQVLTNIINNAIKFTERGSITLSSGVQEKYVRIMVKDTGMGIRPEDKGRLFQKFEQLGLGTERKTGGTGLGLAISKEIIERHNGIIGADSEYGKGTEFFVLLPFSGGA